MRSQRASATPDSSWARWREARFASFQLARHWKESGVRREEKRTKAFSQLTLLLPISQSTLLLVPFPTPPPFPRILTMAFALASRVAAVRPTAAAGRRSAVAARPARIAGAVVSFFGKKETDYFFSFGAHSRD